MAMSDVVAAQLRRWAETTLVIDILAELDTEVEE